VIEMTYPLSKLRPDWNLRRAQWAVIAFSLFSSLSLGAQEKPAQPSPNAVSQAQTASSPGSATVAVPAGTKISMALLRYFSSKSAKVGDEIFLQTIFPVAANGKMLIPTGTYVKGSVLWVKRPKGTKDRLEVALQSASMIFANGYAVSLPVLAPPAPADATAQPAPEHKATAPKTYVDFTSEGMVIREGTDPNEKAAASDVGDDAPETGLSLVFQTRGYDDLLDAAAPVDLTLASPLVLEMERVQDARKILAAKLSPLKPLPPRICYSPGSPGTSDTIIPGSPGTPDTVIPGINGAPPTVIPGIPPTAPTVIHGMPGTPGTSYPCPR
jgi:hypothetical protein